MSMCQHDMQSEQRAGHGAHPYCRKLNRAHMSYALLTMGVPVRHHLHSTFIICTDVLAMLLARLCLQNARACA